MNIFFFFHDVLVQSDNTTVSLAAAFFKKLAIIIAILGQKKLHWQLNKVILSGMYNCNFKAINYGLNKNEKSKNGI